METSSIPGSTNHGTEPRLELKNRALAGLLAWLVPGLGHMYQGRLTKGVLFALCIYSLFFTGFAMGGWRNVYFRWDTEVWQFPYLAQAGMGIAIFPGAIHRPEWRQYLPPIMRKFQARPMIDYDRRVRLRSDVSLEDVLITEDELDKLHRERGKLMDIALVYTMVAGLLNFLVVYDAVAGPALYLEECRELAARSKIPGDEV